LRLSCFAPNTRDALEALSLARVVVVWPAAAAWFGQSFAQHLSRNTYALDAGIGTILPDGIAEAQRRGCLLLRINIWPASDRKPLRGSRVADGNDARRWDGKCSTAFPVVAGGAMGQSGDVIVDSAHHPTRVIGVCDGQGGVRFRFQGEDVERVRRVQAEINRRLVVPQMASTNAS
jgi:hypothetical protein